MQQKEIIKKIESSIVKIMNFHLRKSQKEEGSFSSCDGFVKKEWHNLIITPLNYKKKNQEARESCRWKHPPCGWSKLNFDGAYQGNLGEIGIAYIINNESGIWIVERAKSINSTTNNIVELKALQEGFSICSKLGLSKTIIKGDS